MSHFSFLLTDLLSAHSDLGIGGLQFGGQPLNTGINGASPYGMFMLCYYV